MAYEPPPLWKFLDKLLVNPPRDTDTGKSPITRYDVVKGTTLDFADEIHAVGGLWCFERGDGGEGLPGLLALGTVEES
jgi:hypothetical protein